MYKEEAFFFTRVYIYKIYQEICSKGRCAQGCPKVKRKKLTTDVLVSPNSPYFIQTTCVLRSSYYSLRFKIKLMFGHKLCYEIKSYV
jgi:hypothetical protein